MQMKVEPDTLPNSISFDFLDEYTNTEIIALNLSWHQAAPDEQYRAEIV